MAGSRSAGYGAPRGPGGAWRGPVRQAGERESGGRHGRRAVPLNIPALPETTDLPPNPRPPISPSTPQGHTRWQATQPGPREGWGVEGEMQGGTIASWAGHSKGRPGPRPVSHRAAGKAKKVPFHPQPWPRGSPQPTTIPCPPQPAPPNNNQRKRKRCHLPMPALRVSKPSGMGGARQLLGAWRGGGLPGGGHGTLPGAPKLT